MFTGIIEMQGEILDKVEKESGYQLIIRSAFPMVQVGESIAVNGVCLTLLTNKPAYMVFDVSSETLALTTLRKFKQGERVNLERAMAVSGRFGGHYVSGHVDTTASVKAITTLGDYLEVIVGDFPSNAGIYLIPKASIALNGVSLTINEVNKGDIKLMLVPHTLANTTFRQINLGQQLNVEYDYFARIIAHQINMREILKKEVDA